MRQAEQEEVEGLQADRAGGTHGRGKERESPRMRAEWVGCLFFGRDRGVVEGAIVPISYSFWGWGRYK
jgi:hypothetical protein